jgi:anti-anti-sigma factor
MTTIQVKKSKGISKTRIHGELTLPQVSTLKTTLLKAFQKSNHIELNLEAVTRLDLAGFQLLCAACKYAQKQKKILNRVGELPDNVISVLHGSNYSKGTGCAMDTGNECRILTGEK